MFEAEALICPKCGNPREVCSNPDGQWYPQRSTCYATAMLNVAEWRWSEKHKGAERTKEKAFLPTDGVTVWVSDMDLTPKDKFI